MAGVTGPVSTLPGAIRPAANARIAELEEILRKYGVQDVSKLRAGISF